MRLSRKALALLVLAFALTVAVSAGGSSFGGFVGSASRSVSASVDSLPDHVTVTPGPSGTLELHNPTSEPQSLELELIGAPGGVSASFGSTGADHATLPAGADDTIELSGPAGASVRVRIAVSRTGGTPFPSGFFSLGPAGAVPTQASTATPAAH